MDIIKGIGKVAHGNILSSIVSNLEGEPDNPKIQHLQTNMPPFQTRTADLTDKIGVEYFAFESHIPLYSAQKKKSNSPATPTSLRKRSGRATTKKLHLSP